MNIVVAVDNNWGIGRDGKLLCRIPEDMRNFRNLTIGKVVVMGRGTFESLPNQQPLVQRVNIVLSTRMDLREGIEICRDAASLFEKLRLYKSEDIFIIGGSSIYCQLLDYCNYVFVTKILGNFDADKFFPDIANDGRWKLDRILGENTYKGILYRFEVFSNKSVRRC